MRNEHQFIPWGSAFRLGLIYMLYCLYINIGKVNYYLAYNILHLKQRPPAPQAVDVFTFCKMTVFISDSLVTTNVNWLY